MAARATHALRDVRFAESVIADLEIFRGVPPSHLAGVIRQCSALSVRRGALIAARAARLPGVFVLTHGSVELTLGGAGADRRVIRLVSPGETFGEATMLLGRPSVYEAIALADSKLLVISRETIADLLKHDADFARSFVRVLARATVELLVELEASTMQRGAQRLAGYLASLAGRASGPCTVKLPVSKTVVAARLGVKKETLSRLLREFADGGLIAVAQRNISIFDRERLAQVAHPG